MIDLILVFIVGGAAVAVAARKFSKMKKRGFGSAGCCGCSGGCSGCPGNCRGNIKKI